MISFCICSSKMCTLVSMDLVEIDVLKPGVVVTFALVNYTTNWNFLLKCTVKLWMKLFLKTIWASMLINNVFKIFVMATWPTIAKKTRRRKQLSGLSTLRMGRSFVPGRKVELGLPVRWGSDCVTVWAAHARACSCMCAYTHRHEEFRGLGGAMLLCSQVLTSLVPSILLWV